MHILANLVLGYKHSCCECIYMCFLEHVFIFLRLYWTTGYPPSIILTKTYAFLSIVLAFILSPLFIYAYNVLWSYASVQVSVLSSPVKRHHGHGNSYKKEHLIGDGLPFQKFSYCHNGRQHEGTQVDTLLEKKLSYNLGIRKKLWALNGLQPSTHFFQQGHTS